MTPQSVIARTEAASNTPQEEEGTRLLVGKCQDCLDDGLYLDRILLQHFQMSVCLTCKQDRNLREEGVYELMTKSKAKEEFILPDSFFHGLPHVCKPNPRHEAFAPLKLYLKQTLREGAYRLYDGKEGLAEEKARRKKKAYVNAAKRTKHLLKRKHWMTINEVTTENDKKNKEALNEKEDTSATHANTYVPIADRDHRHAFTIERYDETAASWVKECSCGMKVQFEKW